jgi:hypothetical protein
MRVLPHPNAFSSNDSHLCGSACYALGSEETPGHLGSREEKHGTAARSPLSRPNHRHEQVARIPAPRRRHLHLYTREECGTTWTQAICAMLVFGRVDHASEGARVADRAQGF